MYGVRMVVTSRRSETRGLRGMKMIGAMMTMSLVVVVMMMTTLMFGCGAYDTTFRRRFDDDDIAVDGDDDRCTKAGADSIRCRTSRRETLTC